MIKSASDEFSNDISGRQEKSLQNMDIDPKKWEASDDTLRNREVSAANAALADQPNPSAKRVRFNARPQIFDAQQSGMFISIHFSIIVLYFTI